MGRVIFSAEDNTQSNKRLVNSAPIPLNNMSTHGDDRTLENVRVCITALRSQSRKIQRTRCGKCIWKRLKRTTSVLLMYGSSMKRCSCVSKSHTLLISMFVSMISPKTALYSATVCTSIIEFYKKLDPGSDFNTADQPSRPSASMI